MTSDNDILKAWERLIVLNQDLPRLAAAMSPKNLDIFRHKGKIIIRLHVRNNVQKEWFETKKRALFEYYLQRSVVNEDVRLSVVSDEMPAN